MAVKVPGIVKTAVHTIWIFCAVSVVLIMFLGFNVNLGAAAQAAGRAVAETWNFILVAWETLRETARIPSPDGSQGGRF